MMPLLDFLWTLGPWNWIALAMLLILAETILPGVHLLWFGIAAFFVGALVLILQAIAPGMAEAVAWQWQVLLFSLIAISTVFFIRRSYDPDAEPSDVPALNERAAQYIGRTFTLATAIEGGRGKVRVGDTLWNAAGPDLPAGARVRVTGARGSVLEVEPA